MATLIVLFNLQAGTSREDCEHRVRSTDLPQVRSLAGVRRLQNYRTSGPFSSSAAPPCQYVEVIDIDSVEGLAKDLASATMQCVAAEFHDCVDRPVFIVAEPL